MKQFPVPWLNRLNVIVTSVRRRQRWEDVHAIVQPPVGSEHPPVLRLEKSGSIVIVPLDKRTIEQAMRTGQEGPLISEIKQAFFRVMKTSQRREQLRSQPRKKSFF